MNMSKNKIVDADDISTDSDSDAVSNDSSSQSQASHNNSIFKANGAMVTRIEKDDTIRIPNITESSVQQIIHPQKDDSYHCIATKNIKPRETSVNKVETISKIIKKLDTEALPISATSNDASEFVTKEKLATILGDMRVDILSIISLVSTLNANVTNDNKEVYNVKTDILKIIQENTRLKERINLNKEESQKRHDNLKYSYDRQIEKLQEEVKTLSGKYAIDVIDKSGPKKTQPVQSTPSTPSTPSVQSQQTKSTSVVTSSQISSKKSDKVDKIEVNTSNANKTNITDNKFPGASKNIKVVSKKQSSKDVIKINKDLPIVKKSVPQKEESVESESQSENEEPIDTDLVDNVANSNQPKEEGFVYGKGARQSSRIKKVEDAIQKQQISSTTRKGAGMPKREKSEEDEAPAKNITDSMKVPKNKK